MCDCSISYSIPELSPEDYYREAGEAEYASSAGRPRVYRFLSRLLDHESGGPAVSDWAVDFAGEARHLPFELGPWCTSPPSSAHRGVATGHDERSSGHSQVPLDEARHFYDYYGFSGSTGGSPTASYLATAFAFMAHLASREAQACSPRLQQSLREAQRQFLAKVLLPSLADAPLSNSADSRSPLMHVARTFVAHDLAFVGSSESVARTI
jgi:hypothetical protein